MSSQPVERPAWQPEVSTRVLIVAALTLVLSMGVAWGGTGTSTELPGKTVPGSSRVGIDQYGDTYVDFTPGHYIPGFAVAGGGTQGRRHPARVTMLLGLAGVVVGVRDRSRMLVRGTLVFATSGLVLHSTTPEIAGSPGPLLFMTAVVLAGVGTGAFRLRATRAQG